MTKLQELLLSGGSRYGTKYFPQKTEVIQPSGCCIKTQAGWRTLKPAVSFYRYTQDDQKAWHATYERDNDPRFNPLLRSNRPLTPEAEDGRYRDGFIYRDGGYWTHKLWGFYRQLHDERVEMTAERITRRGHDQMKVPDAAKSGRFDKFGVKVMT